MIKKVFYPRPSENNAGIFFPALSVFDPATIVGTVPSSFIQGKRPSLDVRRNITEHNGWLSNIASVVPQYFAGASGFHNPGFVTPRKRDFKLLYHVPYLNDNAFAFTQVPVATFIPAQFPAIDFQSRSFRTQVKRRVKTDRSGAPRYPGNAATFASAYAQLLGGFISPSRRTLPIELSAGVDLTGVLTVPSTVVIDPFTIPKLAAVLSQRSDITPKRRLDKRGYELLWNTVPRMFGVVFEDESITVASMAQLLNSFRTNRRARLDLRTHLSYEQNIASFSHELFESVIARFPATISEFIWAIGRKKRPETLYDFQDLGAWWYPASAFDPALFPAFLTSLFESYRMHDGKKINVRYLDIPHDGWLSFETTLHIPTLPGVFSSLLESFRMPNRRITNDLWRVESFPPLSFLHDVIPLEDAPFGIPRAHWRHIEGAIRARRRKRRGR